MFLIHYLDDYFFANSSRERCQRDMEVIQQICRFLGVPLAPEKIIGPTHVLSYLGIEIDTVNMIIRLPTDKLEKLKQLISSWQGRKKATKRELLSLIGFLAFAAKVVKPGRMFLRRLIDLSTTVSSLNFFVTLNTEARADLKWWQDFLPDWNGVELFEQETVTSREMHLYSDASDLGLGCLYGKHWISSGWKYGWNAHHINVRELFAIWVAVHTWGEEWANKHILFFTDSLSMTQVWQTGTSKDKVVMRLVRKIFMVTARLNINLTMKHIPGKENTLADKLSRLQVEAFKMEMPMADKDSTVISEAAWTIPRL